jgi:hypothetical protein
MQELHTNFIRQQARFVLLNSLPFHYPDQQIHPHDSAKSHLTKLNYLLQILRRKLAAVNSSTGSPTSSDGTMRCSR